MVAGATFTDPALAGLADERAITAFLAALRLLMRDFLLIDMIFSFSISDFLGSLLLPDPAERQHLLHDMGQTSAELLEQDHICVFNELALTGRFFGDIHRGEGFDRG